MRQPLFGISNVGGEGVTLKELAKQCGVSASTVSRVVNGGTAHAASKEVTDRIWRTVHETGYIPNRHAQSLQRGTHTAAGEGITLACIFARACDLESGQFFAELFRIIEQECAKCGCSVTGIFPSQEPQPLNLPPVDGVIVMGRCPKTILHSIKKHCKNILLVGLNSIQDNQCDQVICNGYEAAKTAVEHLYQCGHTRIAYIGERSEEARYRGDFDALKAHRIMVEGRFIFNAHMSMRGGYQSGLAMLNAEPRPTAVFCANDITASGVMKALRENDVRIPEDISVISVDNMELCKTVAPTLTSIHIPRKELGHFAVRILLDRIAKEHSAPVKLEIPFTLIKRQSCKSI